MLQTPTLIDPSRYPFLPQTRQIRRVEHADLNSVRTMFGDQRSEKRCRARIGCFTSAAQGIRQNGYFEIGVILQGLVQGLDELMLCFADVQRRKVDAPASVADFVLRFLSISSELSSSHGR